MSCNICKKDHHFQNMIRIKGGYICQECYDKFPIGVQNFIKHYKAEQLAALAQIVHDRKSQSYINIGQLGIAHDSICIKNKEIRIKDIRRISLNFHPSRPGTVPFVCFGTPTVIIETKTPHFLLEESFYDKEILVKYYIIGRNISYIYNPDVAGIFKDIQNVIANDGPDLTGVIQKWRQNKKSSSESWRRRTSSHENKKTEPKTTEFAQAKKMYGVEIPYTKELLRQKKMELVKQYHPDRNMQNQEEAAEKMKQILRFYEVLLPFAIEKK